MWDRLWHNYKLKLFDSFIVRYIFFGKLKIGDKIGGACIFDHILKCGKFCVGFAIRTKGFLSVVWHHPYTVIFKLNSVDNPYDAHISCTIRIFSHTHPFTLKNR